MKSKHPEICKTFILIFFLTLQLSSAIPISKEKTSKQQSCRSWLASEVDKRIVPAQIADSYRLFALRGSTTLKQLQDVDSLLKNGRVCDGLGDASNLQVVFDSIQETKSQEVGVVYLSARLVNRCAIIIWCVLLMRYVYTLLNGCRCV